ncbi:MAG: hypothetical protein K2X64_06480 [Rhodocyclaceae bacterium]|nr:hypothetical protein [Rhodocyclaceae bacterium]
MGNGYMQAEQRQQEQVRLDEDRAMRKQQFDAQMDEVKQAKDLRVSLANASKPVQVEASPGAEMAPNVMGPSPVALSLANFKVGDKSYLDRAQADAEAASQNTPEAMANRQANAYRASGAPEKAITLENAAVARKRADEQYTQEQKDLAARYHQEGLMQAAKALRQGDAKGVLSAFNAGGDFKLEGEPEVTREDREVPGIGTIPTYNAKVRLVGPDGKVQERSINSHDLSMSLMPYEKSLEFMGKSTKDAEDTKYKSGMLGAAQKNAEAAMLRAQRTGSGEGSTSKAPAGYRYSVDGKTLEAIPGGPADKASTNSKPLAGSVVKQLQETGDNAVTIANLSNSFKDNFANKGILGAGADGQLSLSATLGKDKDSVDWWKNYRKQAELVERHASFGASLTPGEQESWRAADIGPGMHPDVIRRNLQTRATLSARMLDNARQDAIDAGHSEDRVNLIAGRRTPGSPSASGMQSVVAQMPKAREALKAGVTYQTSRGPAKWNGTAFEAQ